MTSPRARPDLETLGSVLAVPGRLRILRELLAGPPLPAGALAARVGRAPSTVSFHLARLADAGLVRVERVGRTRLARLADDDVADAVETLLRLTAEPPVTSLNDDSRRTALRTARSCYDHLAGKVGVALADLGLRDGWMTSTDGTWGLADPSGAQVERSLGLRLRLAGTSRPLVRRCADWTERRPHIAGRLGQALLAALLADGWVVRRGRDRALTITPRGRGQFARLGIDHR